MDAAGSSGDLPGVLATLLVIGYLVWIILSHRADKPPK